MVAFWFVAVTALSLVFIVRDGITFALCFLGTVILPTVAVGAFTWVQMFGDNQQKFGIPIIAVILLGFAYWLSTNVSLGLYGYNVDGFILLAISATIGLLGVIGPKRSA
jgi:hypothetical protein